MIAETSAFCGALAICVLASSSSSPYRTPDGHAGSQLRQPRHSLICAVNVGSSSGSVPSSTLAMRPMRPRGEDRSSKVRRYVGQTGRQKPHLMHVLTIASDGMSGATKPASTIGVRSGRERRTYQRACRIELRLEQTHE